MIEKNTDPKPSTRMDRFGGFIDSAIFAVAPQWGERRMVSRMRRRLVAKQLERVGDRFGHPTMHPSTSRDSRFVGTRQTSDEMLHEDLKGMQYRSREMVQTNPHAAGAVEGRVAHEIGVGLACRPEIQPSEEITEQNAREANKILTRVCKEWSDRGVDRQRQFSLSAMQRITQREYASYGEAFVLLREAPFEGSIGLTYELITPTRCETPPEFFNDPNVGLGIRYDSNGQIEGYYFRKVNRRLRSRKTEYEYIRRVDANGLQRVCHLFEPLFSDQTRGLPWLMAAIPFLKDCDDFHESELIAKQVEACFGLIIKGGKKSPTPLELAEGNASSTDHEGYRIEELEPGLIQYMDKDGDVTTVDPNRPGGNFAPFIEHTIRAASAAANMPYELMAKNFFRTTYSSGRLAMLDGKLGFDMRTQPTVDMVMKPVHRAVVHHSFFHGHMDGVASRVTYLSNILPWQRHEWGGDDFGAVDPEKAKKANKIALETDQDTLARIAAAQNLHWRDLLEQRNEEKRKQIEDQVSQEAYRRDLRVAAGLPIDTPEDPNDDEDDELIETDDPDEGAPVEKPELAGAA